MRSASSGGKALSVPLALASTTDVPARWVKRLSSVAVPKKGTESMRRTVAAEALAEAARPCSVPRLKSRAGS
jgi:hypothetical protein